MTNTNKLTSAQEKMLAHVLAHPGTAAHQNTGNPRATLNALAKLGLILIVINVDGNPRYYPAK